MGVTVRVVVAYFSVDVADGCLSFGWVVGVFGGEWGLNLEW